MVFAESVEVAETAASAEFVATVVAVAAVAESRTCKSAATLDYPAKTKTNSAACSRWNVSPIPVTLPAVCSCFVATVSVPLPESLESECSEHSPACSVES